MRDQTESDLYAFPGNTKVFICIGGNTIHSRYIIPKLIKPFSTQFLDISIKLDASDTMQNG